MPYPGPKAYQARNALGRFTRFGGRGGKEMAMKLGRVIDAMPDRVAAALYKEAVDILNISKRDLVPVDLGPLRASGHVQLPVRKGKRVSVTIGYGGPSAAYAVVVHEHPSDMSPYSWRNAVDEVRFSPAGRGPKYLERPFMAATRGMAERISEQINIERMTAMG